MTTAIPLLGWTLFTGVCAIPVFKGTRMLAEWLEERPDGSVVKGSSNALIPAMSSLLAFGALAYGFGFGGIAGIAGGAATGSTISQYAVPNTPSVDIVVFAETHDSLFWLGTPFNGEAGDSHDSTQVQIDSVGAAFGTNVFHDATTSALERDTLPPVSAKTLPAYQARPNGGDIGIGGSWPATGSSYNGQLKARIRYKGEGGWSAWSDSVTFTMAQTLETFGSPVIDEDFEYYEIIDSLNACNACNNGSPSPFGSWSRDGNGAGGSGPYIDTTTGYNGRRHSLRYDFYVADSTESQTIGRQIDFDDLGIANQTEIWLEFPIRYDTDFRTNPLGSVAGPGDHKLLFGNTAQNNTYRWELKIGSNSWTPTNPNGICPGHAGAQSANTCFGNGWNAQDTFWDDGEWHTVRIHWKHSVPANATNGIQEYWVDGDSAFAETGFATISSDSTDGQPNQDYIISISMGRNKDDGPTAKLISLWWGYMKVWTSNPGW